MFRVDTSGERYKVETSPEIGESLNITQPIKNLSVYVKFKFCTKIIDCETLNWMGTFRSGRTLFSQMKYGQGYHFESS